ncbi:hypothetical protein ACFGVS_16060 [Mucilaginibacter sp. AW1-7]|uniref:hypothetical protein n=1 Tax=Mucilaginibacter sp. AW1-7 TaxID=3349874 RepID=UPI003F73BBC4
MVNLKQVTLNSEGQERHLHISPVLLHAPTLPSLKPPFKAFVYEGLIEENLQDRMDEETKKMLEKHPEFKNFIRPGLVIKYEQDFACAYLGCLVLNAGEDKNWQWEGNRKNLTTDDVVQIETFMNTLL